MAGRAAYGGAFALLTAAACAAVAAAVSPPPCADAPLEEGLTATFELQRCSQAGTAFAAQCGGDALGAEAHIRVEDGIGFFAHVAGASARNLYEVFFVQRDDFDSGASLSLGQLNYLGE